MSGAGNTMRPAIDQFPIMIRSLRTILRVTLGLVLCAALSARVLGQDTNQTAATVKPTKAAEKTEKEKAPKTDGFRGKVEMVDTTNMTITLDDKAKRVFLITSETLVFTNGKPAILSDAINGEAVHGTYKKTADGKLSATTAYFGTKSEKSEGSKSTAKKSKEKESATNAVPNSASPVMTK